MTDAKRILFLADINSLHTERWVKSLMAKGFDVAVFSLGVRTRFWMDDLEGFTYHCHGLQQDVVRSSKWSGKLGYFSAIKDVRAFCKKFAPDIVHAHYASSYGMLAMRLKFPNSVLSIWGSDVYKFPRKSIIHRWLLKKILRSFSVVCSTSLDMSKEAKKYVDKEYHITPFGVDTERFKPEKQEREEFVVGTVKLLEDVYGIDRLIRVFSEFNNTYEGKTRLLLFGTGSKEEELKELTRSLEVEELVEFRGFAEGQEVVDAFNSFDVFVALSRSESFGVAVLEAQSCGVPVLVSNVGGLPEVAGEESGFVIDGDDISAGVNALMDLTEQEKRERMSKEARKYVIENYSEEVCVNKLLKVYDQL